jgi:hypothetical protein
MPNFLKKFKNSNFLGQQLSRFRMAMSYYAMLISTISAIMLVKTAYPIIQIEWIILVSPIPILITLVIGYILDKHNINTMDSLKSIEMQHRFLNTGDIKAQEFQLMQTQLLLQAIQSMKEGKDVDFSLVKSKYDEYIKKWKSPYQ